MSPWGRELMAVLSFEAIVFWPCALYFYLVYPDWSWLYLIDPHRLPPGSSFLVLLADVATLLGGYLIGWVILRARKPKVLYGALGAVFAGMIAFVVVARARLVNQATFAEFHAGRTLSVAETKLVWAMVVTSLGVAAAAALVGFALWEQGKRFRND